MGNKLRLPSTIISVQLQNFAISCGPELYLEGLPVTNAPRQAIQLSPPQISRMSYTRLAAAILENFPNTQPSLRSGYQPTSSGSHNSI